jgi:hypothetical protein
MRSSARVIRSVLARSSNRLPSGQLRFTQARNLPALLDPTWSGFSSPLAAQFLFRVYDGARTPPEELVIPAFSLRSGDRTSKGPGQPACPDLSPVAWDYLRASPPLSCVRPRITFRLCPLGLPLAVRCLAAIPGAWGGLRRCLLLADLALSLPFDLEPAFATGMHGIERRGVLHRAPRLSAPHSRVFPRRGSSLPGTPLCPVPRCRSLVPAFPSPATTPPSGGTIPGS